MNALVASRYEVDGVLAVSEVVGDALRDRRQREVLRRQEELHVAVGVHEVLEVPEVDIPGEGPEEVEEVGVAAECICCLLYTSPSPRDS